LRCEQGQGSDRLDVASGQITNAAQIARDAAATWQETEALLDEGAN
jgi:hypothetical protein